VSTSISIGAWSLGPANLSNFSVSLRSYPFSMFWIHSEINQTKPFSLPIYSHALSLLPRSKPLLPLDSSHVPQSIEHMFAYFRWSLLSFRIVASSLPLSVSLSLCLSVSWLPSSQSLNNPMTLKAFWVNRFEFLSEIFILNSRRFYDDLPTVKASIILDAPYRSIVVASIRLVTRTITRLTIPQADASIPGMFSLGLCQDWVVAS
jgi:hypothetical protein